MTSGYAEKEAEAAAEDTTPVNYRAVLLGTSFGKRMAREIVESGENSHLVQSMRGMEQHVTKPLLEIYDVPVMDVWVHHFEECTRMAPLRKKLTILTNEYNHLEFKTWAADERRCSVRGGLPLESVVSNGQTGSAAKGVVQDLAKFIAENGIDSNLVVVDGDYVAEPDFSVQRIVEHAAVRGKDTITYTPAPREEMTETDAATVSFDLPGANPKVTAITPGVGKKVGVPALGPVTVLRRTTLPLLLQWVAEQTAAGTMPPPRLEMQTFLSWLCTVVPVYGLEMKYVFSLKTMDGFLYIDNLYEYVSREKAKGNKALKVQDTDLSLDFATQHSSSDVAKRRMHAQFEKEAEKLGDMRRQAVAKLVNLDLILPVFDRRYKAALKARLHGEVQRALPERFSDASLFRHAPRQQHACYTTTSNAYGVKQPTRQEMPTLWTGIKGDFTTGFRGAMFHNTGFVTGVTTSKVHKSLDDHF